MASGDDCASTASARRAGASFAAFVITWKRAVPLRRSLGRLLAQTRPPARILVLDNGADAETARAVSELANPTVEYLAMADNLGPAGAAAAGLERLASEGWDWIYWGDDDDPPAEDTTFERLLDLAERDARPRLAAVGAVGARWSWRHGRLARLEDDELHGAVEVDMIAGGQQLVVSREAVLDVGAPDPRLFFCLEDLEYCLRLRRAGWRAAVDGELMRECRARFGRLGPQLTSSLLPRESRSQLWRRYYSSRNYVFMMRRTFGRSDLASREARRAVVRSAASWLRGPAYGAAFTRCQLGGVIDGYRQRLGRTLSPQGKP